MTKQPDNIGDDAQESLVQALESIKGLLEKSESKLSAARESIALANSSSKRNKQVIKDDDIPVLQDVVVPTPQQLPVQNSSPVSPAPANPVPVIEVDDMTELLDEFQKRVNALISKTIASSSILTMEKLLQNNLELEIQRLKSRIKESGQK